MEHMLIPVMLVVFVCLPAILTLVLLLAQTPVGRMLGLQAKGKMSLGQYLRVIAGRPLEKAKDEDWAQFEILMSQVASGQVHIHDKLGPDAPQDGSLPELGPERANMRIIVLKLLAIPFTVAFLIALLVTYTIMSGAGSAQEGQLRSVTGSIKTGEPWTSLTATEASVPLRAGELGSVVRNAISSGFNMTCPDIPAATMEALKIEAQNALASSVGPINLDQTTVEDQVKYASCTGTLGNYTLSFTKTTDGYTAGIKWEAPKNPV